MKAENPSHALGVVVADELARAGVTDAVIAPGSRSTALSMALDQDPRIRVHVQIDERSAAFVAIGLARATARPAAVVTTSGTAVANLHPAVLEADAAGVPLLLLTADRPPELRNTGANQTVDQIKLFGDAVRWFVELGVPEDVPGAPALWRSTLARAVAVADGRIGRPGPVHLNLAFREPTVPAVDDGRSRVEHPYDQPLDGRGDRDPWLTVTPGQRQPDGETVERLARLVAGHPRGLLVIGATSAPAGPLHALAEAAGWPVVAEATSNARYGDDLVAHAGPLLGVRDFAVAHRPDVIIQVGRLTVAGAVLSHLAAAVEDGARHVLLDEHAAAFDPGRTIAEIVAVDPAALAAAVAEQLPASAADAASAWRSGWMAADEAAAAAIAEALDGHARPIEPQVARDVYAAVPRGGALVVASSMPIRDLDAYAAARDGVRVVANRGVSGIDGFVSTALGVALGHDGPVVALAGDLSLLHDRNGFLLAPEADGLDAVFVVIDNDGGGIFHLLPAAAYPDSFERVFGTPHGVDMEDVARTHALRYQSLHAGAEVDLAVRVAADAGGVHLLHVRTDRPVNAELHRRLQAAIAAAVTR